MEFPIPPLVDNIQPVAELQAVKESEQSLRSLFEGMTEGVALHHVIRDEAGKMVDYRIIAVNPTYQKMIGLCHDNMVGKTSCEIFNAQTPLYLEEYASVTENHAPLKFDTYFEPLDRFFTISAIPWSDGFAAIFFDITDRVREEEARDKALSFLKTLQENSPMGIRVFDGQTGNCVQANKASADIAGGSIDALLKQNFRELQSWREAGLDKLAESVLADGIARQVEVELHTSFGKQEFVLYFLSRFTVEKKHNLLIIGQDITDKKHMAEENRRIEAQMLHVQKLESLGVLAGGIAHDFNNILMAILGNADLAITRIPPESPACHNLRQIEIASRRAADLASQMLAYSGKGSFFIEKLYINTIIEEMAPMLEISTSKKAMLSYDFAPALPAIKADATQLRQIVMNLAINASEAIGDNSGIITITTGAGDFETAYLREIWIEECPPAGRYVYLEIADTGCGIEQEMISRIFDPFFTTKFTGRGLGMAAVLGIVRSHLGTIKVHSEVGKGTTFRILFPVTI